MISKNSRKIIVSILFLLIPSLLEASSGDNTTINLDNSSAEVGVDDATMLKAGQQAMQSFNTWFGAHLENPDQLESFGISKISAYFSKLRTCTPGTYQYPVSDPMALYQPDHTKPIEIFSLGTATILGTTNGVCVVNITIKSKDHVVNSTCNYSAGGLSIYTDEFAKSYFAGGASAYLDLAVEKKPFLNECKQIATTEDTKALDDFRVYVDKLKSCTPGTYTMPRGVGKLVTTVSGYNNDKCILQGVLYVGNTTTTIKCAYTQESLDFFANETLKAMTPKNNSQTSVSSQQSFDSYVTEIAKTINSQALTPEFTNKAQKAFSQCDSPWVPF